MKTIMCFGDSNTHGDSPERFVPGGIVGRYSKVLRWPGRLQQLLGKDYEVIEEGLNGRTTVWDDGVEGDKNGKKHLPVCLSSHAPIDLVILMLGTNDMKVRFAVTPSDIAASVEVLVEMIYEAPNNGWKAPKILVVAPVLLCSQTFLGEVIGDRREDSRRLGELYQEVAERWSAGFLNLAEHAQASQLDGIHMDQENHQKAAQAIYKEVTRMLQ